MPPPATRRQNKAISSSGGRAFARCPISEYHTSATPFTAGTLLGRAVPIATFYLTEILVGLTDLAVVGALGTIVLAAVGVGKTLLFAIMVIGFAVLSVGTVPVAERPGPARCGSVVAASLVVAFFSAIAFMIGGISGAVLTQSGYDPDIVAAFDRAGGPWRSRRLSRLLRGTCMRHDCAWCAGFAIRSAAMMPEGSRRGSPTRSAFPTDARPIDHVPHGATEAAPDGHRVLGLQDQDGRAATIFASGYRRS